MTRLLNVERRGCCLLSACLIGAAESEDSSTHVMCSRLRPNLRLQTRNCFHFPQFPWKFLVCSSRVFSAGDAVIELRVRQPSIRCDSDPMNELMESSTADHSPSAVREAML